jgi:DNA-binding transcriptional regulator YiaG
MTLRRGSRHNLTRAEWLSGGTAALYAKRGADLPQARLTPEQVRAIRASTEPAQPVAQRYGVHENTVRAIRNRDRWGWLA